MHGGADPDAALIKALVSNSADDMGNPGPDFTFGFGMINARTSVEAMEQNHYFTGSVSNNGNASFTIPAVPAGAYQVKIMLYWPDPAAQPFAAGTLVNDLDLTVTDPSGTHHLPMILDPSPSNVNNNAVEGADHRNNIEQVVINNPPAGSFTVSVKGTAVAQDAQPFYIAYEIIRPSVTVEYPFGTETLCRENQPYSVGALMVEILILLPWNILPMVGETGTLSATVFLPPPVLSPGRYRMWSAKIH